MIGAVAMVAAGWATSGFDPTSPEAVFEGRETFTQDEAIKLWAAIERHDDPDRILFHPESFNDGLRWRDTETSPWIATAFGTDTPPSSTFLLHIGPSESIARGTPILMIHGAGDNASRSFVTLATRLDQGGRPVYAITFAHPHGDVFLQAEVVADAIAVIRARTGATEVDVIGHSKGGIAAAVHAANRPGLDLGDPDYLAVGTPYAGDIRRLVLIAVPLGGVDTSYRWPGLNLYGLVRDATVSPTSWDRYYPSSTLFPLIYDSLADQDFLPDGLDLFPGQRQVLKRQPPPLPGTRPWLGVYALQPDWYTTYEGGLGFWSRSDGIDAAISAGGSLIDTLAAVGIDPDIETFQLAGTSPLLPNGDDALADQFGQLADVVDYEALLADLTAHGIAVSADADELAGLEGGQLVLGEISDPSDGLVLLSSASDTAAITARGGTVAERYTVDLSHLDLLYASPITGQLLIDAADEGLPEDAWMRGVGQRYIAADTLGWIEGVLADPPEPAPTADTAAADTGGGDTATPAPPNGPAPAYPRPCGSCTHGGAGSAVALGWALAAVGWRRPPRGGRRWTSPAAATTTDGTSPLRREPPRRRRGLFRGPGSPPT